MQKALQPWPFQQELALKKEITNAWKISNNFAETTLETPFYSDRLYFVLTVASYYVHAPW